MHGQPIVYLLEYVLSLLINRRRREPQPPADAALGIGRPEARSGCLGHKQSTPWLSVSLRRPPSDRDQIGTG